MQEGYKSEKHNYTLDVWKFTLCVGVICLHMNSYWGLFRTGYLGVDFLLIISGYFLGFSARKLGSSLSIIDYIRELFKWIIKRFIRLYPLYLIAIMMTWGIDNYTTKRTLSDGCYALWQSNTELIMMQSIKWPVWGLINFPDWYVSAIFISGIIVLIVASLLFKAKSKILGFLFGMLCYFLIIYKFSTVDVVTEKWGGLRAIGGLLLGTGINICCLDINIPAVWKKYFMIVSWMLFSLVVLYMNFFAKSANEIYILVLMILSIALCILSYDGIKCRKGRLFCLWLGKISWPIFLFQMCFIKLYQYYM